MGDVSFRPSRACIHTSWHRLLCSRESTAETLATLPRNQLKVIVEIARQTVYSA